ncbi:conserved uncharacterized protein [Erwinia sp. Ejp617]|nr:DUF2946 domain-containing protein [Erwinia sp. Ejp617]ADP10176.1 conserved uncharacterized protein [Erwinia sp. Ejp617]
MLTILHSVTHRRFAACSALLAMLLLFIAPVISKSLAQQRGGDSMMMHHAMGMAMETEWDMSADDRSLAAADSAADNTKRPVLPVMDDSACGYCLLLVHLPLDLLPSLLLWSALLAAGIPDVTRSPPPPTRFTPGFFHPRAPPRYRA